MIAVPAIDLMGGRCVQLRGGVPEDERVSLTDPLAVARRWWNVGFKSLHVVDLDAALGRGDNRALITDLLGSTFATTQVGGGIRTTEAAAALMAAGADRVIVGTRAVDDPDWLAEVSGAHPGRVVLAADIRDGKVLRRGWTEEAEVELAALLAATAALPLAGVLCTDVAKEGHLAGIAVEVARAVVEASPHPVWMSGGITSLEDLWSLARVGAAGAVLGMSLYAGAVDAELVAREFGE